MKDKKLLFDRSCHVLYSKPCKKEMRAKIALHYPEVERETVWEKVQRQYVVFLSDWRFAYILHMIVTLPASIVSQMRENIMVRNGNL